MARAGFENRFKRLLAQMDCFELEFAIGHGFAARGFSAVVEFIAHRDDALPSRDSFPVPPPAHSQSWKDSSPRDVQTRFCKRNALIAAIPARARPPACQRCPADHS